MAVFDSINNSTKDELKHFAQHRAVDVCRVFLNKLEGDERTFFKYWFELRLRGVFTSTIPKL